MNILSQVQIVLGLKTTGFPTARQQIKGFVEGTQRQLAQLKTFVGGYFTAQFASQLVRSVSQMVGRFKDLNETSGEGTETIQKYDQVFKKFGGTAEDAIKIWDELALARKEALENGGEAGIKLQRLGLTPQEIQSLDTGRKLYERIAQISNDPNNPAQRTAFLDQFGKKRGGMALAGAAALNEGGEFSIVKEEDIKALDDAAKAFEKAFLEFKIASVPLIAAMVGWGADLMKWLSEKDENGLTRTDKILAPVTAGKLIGDISDEMAYTAEVNGENAIMAQKLAEAKRRGIKVSELDGFNAGSPMSYDAAVAQASQVPGGSQAVAPVIERMDKDWQNRNSTLGSAFDNAFFKAGNTEDKKAQLRERMKRNEARAAELEESDKPDWKEIDKLDSENIKNAGELADLLSTPHQEFKSDQLAQVGGLIGGAATIDPSLTIQQSQLQVLQSILAEFPALREALNQRNQPHQDLQ